METKVLLVDDDPSILTSTSRLLSKQGFHVETAEGGAEALEKIDDFFPNLVISDMRMPEIDGVELMKRIPVKDGVMPGRIIFTGFDDDEAYSLAKMSEGGVFRVEKDRWETDLMPAINRALELNKLCYQMWEKGKESLKEKEELNKLRLVRTMAVTLGHQINNPLSAIGLANNGLIGQFSLQRNNEIIAESVDDISRVVKKISILDEIKETEYLGADKMLELN